jgi:hypothetical protein
MQIVDIQNADKTLLTNVKNLKIGNNTKQINITDVEIEDSPKGKRVYLVANSNDGAQFKINEAWIVDHTGSVVPKTLWLSLDADGNIMSTSVLGRFLNFFKCTSPAELINRRVTATSKPNGFMAVNAYEVSAS